MTFVAAWYAWAGVAAAAGVLALHFFARRRPRERPLPTARFIPELPVRSPAPQRLPSDRVLLALRVAVVLLVGLALARPYPDRPAGTVTITIGDTVPTFSAAFAAALSALAASGADSAELTLALPRTRDRWDAATPAWRAQWPGRVRLAPAETRRHGAAEVVWPALPAGDAHAGLVVGDIVAVGAFGRGPLPPGAPVAFWHDGAPAAVEVTTETGCTRHVAIGLPPGDMRLRPAFRRIEERLRRPCGAVASDTTPLAPDQLALLEGDASRPAASGLPAAAPPIGAFAWLLVLAAVLLALEQVLRRRT